MNLFVPLFVLSAAWVSPEISLAPTTLEPSWEASSVPSIAFDGTNFLVAYEDDRVPSGIYLTRMAADGTVLNPRGLFFDVGANPAVAYDGTRFLVVYSASVGNSVVLQGKRVALDGTVLDAQPISVSGTGEGTSPVVSFDGTNFVVGWRGSTGILAARVSGAGQLVDTTPITIVSSVSGFAFDVKQFTSASNVGTTLFAWTEDLSSNCYYYGKRLLSDGTVVDSAPLALATDNSAYYCRLDTAANGTGFAVSFIEDTTSGGDMVRLVRVPATGAPSPSDLVTTGNGASNFGWSAVSTSGNDWAVFWTNSGTGNGFKAARVTTAGAAVDATPKSYPGPYVEALSTAIGSGRVVLSYRRNAVDFSGDTVEAARLQGAQLTLQGTSILSNTAPKQDALSLAAGPGQALAVWADGPGVAEHRRLLATRIGRDGMPLDPTPIDVAPGVRSPWLTSAGFDGTNYVVAWEDLRNTDAGIDVYAMRIAVDGGRVDPQPIPIATTTQWERYPKVTSGNGNSLICWSAWSNLRCSILEGDGGVTANTFSATSGSLQNSVAFSTAWNGANYLVTWSDSTNVPDVLKARLLSPSGTALGSGAANIGPYVGTRVDGLAAAGGPPGFLVAYATDSFSSPRFRAVRLAPDAGLIDTGLPPSVSSGNVNSYQDMGEALWDGTQWVIAWSELRTGSGDDVLLRRLTDAGQWVDSQAQVIASAADNETAPGLASFGGSYFVGYVRGDSSPDQQQLRAKLRLFSELSSPGTSCSVGDECGSGACVQGICCTSFCNGACTGGVCQDNLADAGSDAGVIDGTDSGVLDDGGIPGGPAFLTTPPASVACNGAFHYEPQVSGAGPWLFSLTKQPANVQLDSSTGAIDWTPDWSNPPSSVDFELVASGGSGFIRQPFTVQVEACQPIDNEPGTGAGGCHCGAVDGSLALLAIATLRLVRRRRTARP